MNINKTMSNVIDEVSTVILKYGNLDLVDVPHLFNEMETIYERKYEPLMHSMKSFDFHEGQIMAMIYMDFFSYYNKAIIDYSPMGMIEYVTTYVPTAKIYMLDGKDYTATFPIHRLFAEQIEEVQNLLADYNTEEVHKESWFEMMEQLSVQFKEVADVLGFFAFDETNVDAIVAMDFFEFHTSPHVWVPYEADGLMAFVQKYSIQALMWKAQGMDYSKNF